MKKSSCYAEGGKIKGPGTATSDSIAGRIRGSNEPIRVSNNERILSQSQDQAMEGLARKAGYPNLDTMLEAKTGKPVGPTIKGGIRAAATGMSPEERAYRLSSGNIAGPYMPNVGNAIASVLPEESPLGKSLKSAAAAPPAPAAQAPAADVPAPQQAFKQEPFAAKPDALMQQPESKFITGKNGAMPDSSLGGFSTENKSYNVSDTSQPGISKVTAAGTSPLYTNIKPEDAVAGLGNQTIGGDAASVNEGLARTAKANSIRQQMIDSQPQGGFNSLPDYAAQQNNSGSSIVNQLSDQMKRAGTRTERAALGQALVQAMSGQNQLAMESLRGQNQMVADQGRNTTQMRGQDLIAQSEANRLGLEREKFGGQAEGMSLDNQAKRYSLKTAAQLDSLRDAYTNETDPAKKAQLAEQYRFLSNKEARYTGHVVGGGEDEMGRKMPQQLMVVDSTTGNLKGDQKAQAGLPKVGDVQKGHRFKGGDPSNPASWEKI